MKAHNQQTSISASFYKLHEPQKIIGLRGTISALKQPNHQSLTFYEYFLSFTPTKSQMSHMTDDVTGHVTHHCYLVAVK